MHVLVIMIEIGSSSCQHLLLQVIHYVLTSTYKTRDSLFKCNIISKPLHKQAF